MQNPMFNFHVVGAHRPRSERSAGPVSMTFFFWYLIASTILGIGFGYLGRRLISISGIPKRWKQIGWGTVIGLFLFLTISIILQTNTIQEESGIVAWITYVTLGLGSSLLTLVVLRDILLVAKKG